MTSQSNVVPFAFKGERIRHVIIDMKPWFVAADVCRALGLDLTKGSTMHLAKLDADEKRRVTRAGTPNIFWGTRGGGHATIISEPGLYKLIQRSNKPEAREFDRWVRHEVLPAIRQTGGYLLNEQARPEAHADTRTHLGCTFG